MKTVAVGELHDHLSRILQDVQAGESIEITRRGEPIALLLPLSRPLQMRQPTAEEIESSLASLDALSDEIGKHITEPTDVAKMISKDRR